MSRWSSALLLVSGHLYIGDMKKKPDKAPGNRPVLIEVPKPVNQMSKKELGLEISIGVF